MYPGRLLDFNPRSPCGERLQSFKLAFAACRISIHAPRVGSDLICLTVCPGLTVFQSTLPVWGATSTIPPPDRYCAISIHAPRVGSDYSLILTSVQNKDFNPRSPCGERPYSNNIRSAQARISIHAPRVGSDRSFKLAFAACRISIHAPRVGSDQKSHIMDDNRTYFNPRSPCGERLKAFDNNL